MLSRLLHILLCSCVSIMLMSTPAALLSVMSLIVLILYLSLLPCSLNLRRLSHCILINKLLTIIEMKVLTFLKSHLWPILKFIGLCLIVYFVYLFCQRNLTDRSILIGNPDNIYIVAPEASQDVIVIGDPEQVKVKPKKSK